MARRLFYCDHHLFPLPAGHKFPLAKYRILRGLLAADGFFQLEPAPLASENVISLAHDPAYVHRFVTGALEASAMRRIGFPWSEALVRRTRAAAGGTLAAAEEAIATGLGGNLAGGTHHAFRGEGAGFCVFNDIAIAIFFLRTRGLVRRAAVVDLDVHQGDGTAAIFAEDADLFTFSMHGRNNFPFRKQHSTLDVELEDGTGDGSYLDALAGALPRVFDFRPEVVFYQSGVDALAGDRLGRLALTHEGLKQRDRMVMQRCRDSQVPLVITLGGGYAQPISRTAEAHANTFRTAVEVLVEMPKQVVSI